MSSETVRFCLNGSSLDTGNLGVSALGLSVLTALVKRIPGSHVTVFDHGRGLRPQVLETQGVRASYHACGLTNSRRFWRPESIWRVRAAVLLGGRGSPAAAAIRDSSAFLDVSGGDSFTDLYGPRRFASIVRPKQVALNRGVPLVLLPQTYGPFEDPKTRAIACDIIRRARVAMARDARSFAALRELLGSSFDPERHLEGVDVAFGLPAKRDNARLRESLRRRLEDRSGVPLIGFNVSGLLYNDPERAARSFGLRADYRRLVLDFLRRFLEETSAFVLLVPHVLTKPKSLESDSEACEHVAGELAMPERVAVLPAVDDPRLAKGVIAQTDWFCGTRMHATIAGLSSGVPTVALAYSLKTQGVFETCDMGEYVVDPRSLGTEEVVERLWQCWQRRDEARETLRGALEGTIRRAEEQIDRMLAILGLGSPALRHVSGPQSERVTG